MNMLSASALTQDLDFPGTMFTPTQGTIAIVSDNEATIMTLAPVCEFLDLRIQVVPSDMDLENVLYEQKPLAVIADVDGAEQDGFHAMKLVARYDRDLPILLMTGGDPVLMGAADAVQEHWGLTSVTSTSAFPLAGQLVAFLFGAGRRAGCMRLVPV